MTGAASRAPPDGIPHLASPDNLPPGTTMDPARLPAEGPNVSYLKDLWHAVQTQDIRARTRCSALTQRPLTTPYPENVNGTGPAPAVGSPRRSAPDPAAPAPAPGAPACRLPPA